MHEGIQVLRAGVELQELASSYGRHRSMQASWEQDLGVGGHQQGKRSHLFSTDLQGELCFLLSGSLWSPFYLPEGLCLLHMSPGPKASGCFCTGPIRNLPRSPGGTTWCFPPRSLASLEISCLGSYCPSCTQQLWVQNGPSVPSASIQEAGQADCLRRACGLPTGISRVVMCD